MKAFLPQLKTTIAVTQRKGGVGKTTVAVNIAAELHRRFGNVTLIDADPQRSAMRWEQPGRLAFAVHEQPISETFEGEWIDAIRRLPYDMMVIDTPPNERAVGAAVAISDVVIVPCTPSGLDIEATEKTLELVRSARALRTTPLSVLLVPNRIDLRTLEGQQIEAELETFGEPVAPGIASRTDFVRAFATGTSVAEFARNSLGDRQIRALCNAIERQLWIQRVQPKLRQ